MTKAIDYRSLWHRAHRAARMSVPTSRAKGRNVATEARAHAHMACREVVPYASPVQPVAFAWHVDRMARCAAGETVMSKGIAIRSMWLGAAGTLRRNAAAKGLDANRDWLAIARGLLDDNARNRSTFVAPLP